MGLNINVNYNYMLHVTHLYEKNHMIEILTLIFEFQLITNL